MPKDFKSFAHENKKIMEDHKEDVEKYEDIINKYKDMSNDDLMSSLFKEASRLKGEGKLDSKMLDDLKSTISPFLNSNQIDLLNNLVNAINEQK